MKGSWQFKSCTIDPDTTSYRQMLDYFRRLTSVVVDEIHQTKSYWKKSYDANPLYMSEDFYHDGSYRSQLKFVKARCNQWKDYYNKYMFEHDEWERWKKTIV